MKKQKLFLLLAGMLLPCLPVLAGTQVMQVKTVDGKTLSVTLVDNMKASVWKGKSEDSPINFYVFTGLPSIDEDGRPVTVEGEQGGTVYFDMPVSSLDEIEFIETSSAVGEISTVSNIKVDVAEGLVSVTGVQSPVRVVISDLSGMLIKNEIISTDTVFNLKEAGMGVYVVNVDGSQFKLMVK